MPQFKTQRVATTDEVTVVRAICDGCDPRRPCPEHRARASLWLVTAGAFELRDRDGVHAVDPTHALVMPPDHEFVIRHPAGPDTCISFHGPLIERLAGPRARLAEVTPAQAVGLTAELAAWARGEGDELAIAELLASITEPNDAPVHRDRDLAGGISHLLRLAYAENSSLAELADRAGYSMFHACRVFRATTGHTIHGFRRELRLRHALARILDGDEPLVEIASHTGFASQSHLTNLFRARFGVTPAKARTAAGQRSLST
ncbi:MAG: helix-turn-helix transcriptional regulator [Kofleriaceae bacterium]